METFGERRVTCMWHVGLHYLLPFSTLTAEERSRYVLSEDDAGISDYFYSDLGVLEFSIHDTVGFTFTVYDIRHLYIPNSEIFWLRK